MPLRRSMSALSWSSASSNVAFSACTEVEPGAEGSCRMVSTSVCQACVMAGSQPGKREMPVAEAMSFEEC